MLLLLLSIFTVYSQEIFVELPELYLNVKVDDKNIIITEDGSNYDKETLKKSGIDLDNTIKEIQNKSLCMEYKHIDDDFTIYVSSNENSMTKSVFDYKLLKENKLSEYRKDRMPKSKNETESHYIGEINRTQALFFIYEYFGNSQSLQAVSTKNGITLYIGYYTNSGNISDNDIETLENFINNLEFTAELEKPLFNFAFDLTSLRYIVVRIIPYLFLCILVWLSRRESYKIIDKQTSLSNFTVCPPLFYKWVGIAMCLFFMIIFFLAYNQGGNAADIKSLSFIWVLFIICFLLTVYAVTIKIAVSENEIFYTNFFGKTRKYTFDEITNVKTTRNEFVLYSGKKRLFSVSLNFLCSDYLIKRLKIEYMYSVRKL
jgi:uncharacterized Tic20 family protein